MVRDLRGGEEKPNGVYENSIEYKIEKLSLRNASRPVVAE